MKAVGSSTSGKFSVLVGAAVLVALLAFAGSASAQNETWDTRQKSESEDPARDQPVELSGTFSVLWIDPPPGSDTEPEIRYLLVDDRDRETELLLEDATELPEDLQALAGKRVKVEGTGVPGGKVKVRTIESEDPDQSISALEAQTAVTGSKPTATILCRLGDLTDVTPREKSWFETLMGNSYPGMDHYWREASYGNIDLAGSQVFGWYNLPNPRSYYTTNSGATDTTKLLTDCTAAADADVFFPDFTNINLMFNWDFDVAVGNAGRSITRDGQTKTYGVTWLPTSSPNFGGYETQATVAHEMGHTFGLEHSGGMYSEVYDSEWDPMSNTGHPIGQFNQYCPRRLHPDHGCIADHTISYHKDKLSWVPSERKYTATPGSVQGITIERLGNPNPNSGYLMAQIPIGDSPNFYTVEARRFEGYDDNIPGEAVVIHRVHPTTTNGELNNKGQALVVDPDNNGDPNDAGAMWTIGETFTDAANGISVEVVGESESGYDVRISTPSTAPPDTTPPNIWLILPSRDGAVGIGQRTIIAEVADDRGVVDHIEFLVDGEELATDNTPAFFTPWDTTTKTDGRSTVTAQTSDAADNSASHSRWVIVNNTVPDTSITEGPEEGSTTTETSATFEFSSTERDSTFRCKLDNGPEEECSSGQSYPDLEEGEHTFQVWADGAADGAFGVFEDSDPSPATRTWTVEPPEPCTKTGTAGTDVLQGTSGNDVLCGLGGTDVTLDFSGGNDTHNGGEGDDFLLEFDGVKGNDTVDGGPGKDFCLADKDDTLINCERVSSLGSLSPQELQRLYGALRKAKSSKK